MIVQIHFCPPSGSPRFEIRLFGKRGGVSYNTVEPDLQNLLKQRTKSFDFLRKRRDPLHVAASFPTEHPSPAGDSNGKPKPEEAQGSFANDHVANGHGEDDNHGRHLLYSAMSRFVAILCPDLSSY